jgi:cytochrome c-type biogenesis protein CcmH/NrfF
LRDYGTYGAQLPFEKPPHRATSFLLWTLPPLAILVVCVDVVLYVRRGHSFSSYLRRGQSRGGKFE